MINQQRIVDSFIRMVETSSVSGHEGKMRDLLINEFQNRGLSLTEDNAGELLNGEAGNLFIQIPGTAAGPTLLFAAHMDTVEPGLGIKAAVEDGIIKSQGNTILGSDDKAAIAAVLEALDAINENNIPHPPLEFLFTVSEEQGLKGSKAFDYSQLQCAIAYVMDSSGQPGTIIIQGPCQNEIEYRVYGKAAHAGINPEDGVNAIQVAAAALTRMPCGRIDEETTCNFGIIEGGIARNIVADYCRIKGEARSLTREKLDKITRKLVDTFQNEVNAHGARAVVDVKFLYPEINLSQEEKVVQLAVQAAGKIGLTPVLESTGGGSDASIINDHGIPCVNLAIGMSAVHTCDEYIRIEDLVNTARFIVALVQEAAD